MLEIWNKMENRFRAIVIVFVIFSLHKMSCQVSFAIQQKYNRSLFWQGNLHYQNHLNKLFAQKGSFN